MKHLLFCEFNMDTACVELKFSGSSLIAIDTIAIENEDVDNMYQRSELDHLIYDDPIVYADLISCGNPKAYLKAVTEYKSLDLHTPQGQLGARFQKCYTLMCWIPPNCLENRRSLMIH